MDMAHKTARSLARKDGASDPRIGRTRELLVEALVEICGERGMQAVSVAEITRRAGVNRATFYRHFEGKDDLLERGIETLLSTVFEEIEAVAPVGSVSEDRVLARITRFFEVARDRSKFFRLLLSGASGPLLREKAETFVEGFLMERRLGIAGEETLMLPLPMASRVLTSVLFGFAFWWIDNPRSYTAEQMASLCLLVSTRGFFKNQEG
jgi:AcrR family transcriptional regulator